MRTPFLSLALVLCLGISAGARSHGKDNGKPRSGGDSCSVPECYNSNVFAVSWQAGFCLGHSQKPECQNLSKESYADSNFTLHGLWPNRSACGTGYGFCGSVHSEADSFPPVALDSQVVSRLDSLMPSMRYDSGLERHEWWKHGTCSGATPDAYFTQAMNLLDQVNASNFVHGYLRGVLRSGKPTTKKALKAAFDSSFGKDASTKIKVNCDGNGNLTEIQISLPKDPKGPLPELLSHADPQKNGSCSDSIRVPAAVSTSKGQAR